MDDDNTNETIDFLILNGAIEVAGIDESTGEMLFQFTPKIKDYMPEIYDEHLNHVHSEVMRLWELGFLHIDFLSDEPNVATTPKAFDNEAISGLSKDDQWSLKEIKRLMKLEEEL